MIQFIEYDTDPRGQKIFARVDEDGLIRYTCTEDDSQYQAWLNPEAEHFTPMIPITTEPPTEQAQEGAE